MYVNHGNAGNGDNGNSEGGDEYLWRKRKLKCVGYIIITKYNGNLYVDVLVNSKINLWALKF